MECSRAPRGAHDDASRALRVERDALGVGLREEALDVLLGHVACGRAGERADREGAAWAGR